MTNNIYQEIISQAESSDEEIGGFIYFEGSQAKIDKCENIALDKKNFFEVSADDYIKNLKRNLYAIYHSHVNSDYNFSEQDLEISEESCLPIYVYSKIDKKINSYIPLSYDYGDFQGKRYIWGFNDCYGLIRDFYKKEKNFLLPDYIRDESFRTSNFDIMIKEINKFTKKIDDFKFGDLFVFSQRGNAKHLAIYYGDGKILHHPIGKLSVIEEIGSLGENFIGGFRLNE
jgi:proteasome lid subunit RPN8/RPN11